MPGRNAWYKYEIDGPTMIARSENTATVQWIIESGVRFDDRMSIQVRLGVSAVFSQTSHFDLTADRTDFRHEDRKRRHDPVRKISRIENSLDLNYFEEVEYHSLWHYNVASFRTIIRVTGTLLVPMNERLAVLSNLAPVSTSALPAIDTSRMTRLTEISTIPF